MFLAKLFLFGSLVIEEKSRFDEKLGQLVPMMIYEIHGVIVNPDTRDLVVDGERAKLTPLEFKIFDLLARSPGHAFSRRAIIEAIQGDDSPTGEQAIDVHVASLRKKLGKFRDLIETVRSVGFQMKAANS